MPSDTTIARKGRDLLQSTPLGMIRLSSLLFCQPWQMERRHYDSQIPDIVVAYSPNGWMSDKLTKDWVDRVWGKLSFILVWDAYK